jgi:hypothetical protein
VNVFAAILALQIQQFHNQFVRISGVDFSLEENDAILKEQIPEGHLSLPLIALVCGSVMQWRHAGKLVHEKVPFTKEADRIAMYL